MKVNITHSLYNKFQPKWKQMRDTITGDIKLYPETYLPAPFPRDSEYNDRYTAYTTRARYYNMVGRTATVLHGLIFRKSPTIQLPEQLKYLVDNVDGNGTLLEQQAKIVGREVVHVARAGLLVDYPLIDGHLTEDQKRREGIAAKIVYYTTENIINWRRDEKNRLILVVLREQCERPSSSLFEQNLGYQYRVLRLINGTYYQMVIDDQEQTVIEQFQVLDGNRQPFNYIPFYTVGAVENGIEPDEPVLLPLSDINIGHYRNSADYEEMASKMGQASLHVSGYSGESDTVYMGTRSAIPTEQGGKVEIVQLSDNTFLERAMERKELQALQIGARMVFQSGGQEAVGVEQIKASGDNAVMATISENITDAYEKALKDCGRFEGVPEPLLDEIGFDVNKEFLSIPLTLEQYKIYQGLMMDGLLTKETALNELKRRGIAEYVDVVAEIAAAGEQVGNMFGGEG